MAPNWEYDIRKPLPKQQRGNCTEKTRHASLLSAAGAGAPGGGCGGRASITVTCSIVGLLLGFAQWKAASKLQKNGFRASADIHDVWSQNNNNNNNIENAIWVVDVWCVYFIIFIIMCSDRRPDDYSLKLACVLKLHPYYDTNNIKTIITTT